MAKTKRRILYENKKMRQALFLYDLFGADDFEDKLLAASASLSEKKRQILSMYYIENQPIEDIAAHFQEKEKKIQMILRECMKTIRQSSDSRYFIYGVEVTETVDRTNDKIQDNAAILIWLNQVERALDAIAADGSRKISDTDLSDELKQHLLGAKYELVRDLTHLNVTKEIERLGKPLPEIPSFGQIPIEEMGFTARTYNCLKRADCRSLSDICELSQTHLLKIRNMGVKSVQEVIEVLGKYGRHLSN